MIMKLSKEHNAMLASYARSTLAAVLAVTATGNYATDDLVKAAVAALLPVAIRWVNTKDPVFGRKAS